MFLLLSLTTALAQTTTTCTATDDSGLTYAAPNPLVPTEPVPMTCTAYLAPPMP